MHHYQVDKQSQFRGLQRGASGVALGDLCLQLVLLVASVGIKEGFLLHITVVFF